MEHARPYSYGCSPTMVHNHCDDPRRYSRITSWPKCIRCTTANIVRRSLNFANLFSLIRSSELRLDISDAWAKLPRFLIVLSHELWHSPRSRCETECLHQIRLFYLQSVFLIEWAAWRHGIEQSALFQSATELLSWVNEALIHREQLLSVGFVSLAWRVCNFGSMSVPSYFTKAM